MRLSFRLSGPMLLAAGLGLAATGRGQLVSLSPFLPPGANPAAGAGASGPVELRGIMTTPEGVRFCIYDTVKKTSAWVGLNEPGRNFVVKSYDSAKDSVTVAADGRTDRIALHTAKISSGGMPGAGITQANVGRLNPLIQTVVVNPTPADEARRLEAVAAEVQRRRLLRQQAMQGTSPGSAPAPGTSGVQNTLQQPGMPR